MDGKPAAIIARSYFGPFDQELQGSLKELGVQPHFVNDLSYFIEGGDVHCGTNELRVCNPFRQ